MTLAREGWPGGGGGSSEMGQWITCHNVRSRRHDFVTSESLSGGSSRESDVSDGTTDAWFRPIVGTLPRCPTRGKPGRVRRRREFRLVHLSRWLGLAFVAGGFAAIGLAWMGTARESCVDCQLPYLVSGGIGGIALVVLGVGLLIVAQIRTERVRLSELFDNPRAEADASPEADAGPEPDRRSVPASRGG